MYAVSAQLDSLITNRHQSLFKQDWMERQARIADHLAGKRILIVGGGGSIGSATTRLLAGFHAASIHVIDISENYLAELIRDLRADHSLDLPKDFRALPLDYGSTLMQRWLAEEKPYDVVLNFAALKHVRSEKDVYSLLQMLDTNIIKHARFKTWLAEYGHGARYFAVSTDKAANPTSLMGASKRLMEDIAFAYARQTGVTATSARFANVAFSNGSLLQSFLYRLEKRQPLAAPLSTKRYFISHQEAGEVCLLAALIAPHDTILIPRLDPTELQELSDIAQRVLKHFGYQAELFEDELAAKKSVERLAAQQRWPLLLTPLDTSGEKEAEEFIGSDETAEKINLISLLGIAHRVNPAIDQSFLDRLQGLIDYQESADKNTVIALLSSVLPTFSPRQTGRNLDERL